MPTGLEEEFELAIEVALEWFMPHDGVADVEAKAVFMDGVAKANVVAFRIQRVVDDMEIDPRIVPMELVLKVVAERLGLGHTYY